MLSLIMIISSLLMAAAPVPEPCSCLPQNIKLSDVVTAGTGRPGRAPGNKVTVEQKIHELKAVCRKGKLVDSAGKRIYFYRLKGCWGNPPEGYQEILKNQTAELVKLRRTYHVIEMTCNPEGTQPY